MLRSIFEGVLQLEMSKCHISIYSTVKIRVIIIIIILTDCQHLVKMLKNIGNFEQFSGFNLGDNKYIPLEIQKKCRKLGTAAQMDGQSKDVLKNEKTLLDGRPKLESDHFCLKSSDLRLNLQI